MASETIKITTCNIEAHWKFKEKIWGSVKGHAVHPSRICLCSGCHHIWKSKVSSGQWHKVLCWSLWIYKAAVSSAGWTADVADMSSWRSTRGPETEWAAAFTRLGSNTLHEPHSRRGTAGLKCTTQKDFLMPEFRPSLLAVRCTSAVALWVKHLLKNEPALFAI